MKKSLLLLLSIYSVLLLHACGITTPPPPVASHFSVLASSATAVTGQIIGFTVTALDAAGAGVSNYSGTVHFTSSDAQAILPPSSPLTNGSGTFSVTFKTAGNQTISVADAASIAGTSLTVAVSVPSASSFLMTTSTSAVSAGTPVSVTVTAVDAMNNPATSYAGTVHFTSTDMQAVLPANSTLTNGTGTFQVTLKTAGPQSITTTDTVTAAIIASAPPVTVSAGPVAQIALMGPAAATTGLTFNMTVRAVDAFSNVVTAYAGMLHFTSTDSLAVLPPDSALTSGTRLFPVTLNSLGNRIITATDTVSASSTGSAMFKVFSNAATHISITGNPPATLTRQTFHFNVTALDAANNTSTGYAGTVHFSSTDASAMLQANSILAAGTSIFSATLETVGSQTVTATDTTMASISAAASVNVTAASAPAIAAGTPPNGTVGVNYGRFVPTTEYDTCFRTGPNVTCRYITVRDPRCVGNFSNTPCWNGMTKVVDVFHGFTFQATGGVAPYTWSAASMPPGLTLNSIGEILGIPTSPGPFTLTVTATDSGIPSAQTSPGNYPVTMAPPPAPVVNATPPPPPAVVNLPYSFTFTATGDAPLTWKETGALPPGLTFNNGTGVLSGKTAASGSSPISLTATDQFNQTSAVANFTLVVSQHGFVLTGSMGTARRFHTATLLDSGKVLVAGGEDLGSNAFASAELYDPSTGTFTQTKGSMTVARVGHTATLLKNGKVLLAGGASTVSEAAITTAELYDPATGTFTATTGTMTAARASHTATLLNDGTVLLAGGDVIFFNGVQNAGIKSLSSAEIFDPNTGNFTATAGSMTAPRESHAAALLSSGKVLVAGGSDGAVGNSLLAVTEYASSELYDPSTGHFTAAGSMTSARDFLTATLLNTGKVLAAGGLNTAAFLQGADLYDPSSTSFAATGNLMGPRFYHDATLLNDGTVLITGGNGIPGILATAEIYEPTAGTFAITGSMSQGRVWHTSTLLKDGSVLVTGGGTPLATCELYE